MSGILLTKSPFRPLSFKTIFIFLLLAFLISYHSYGQHVGVNVSNPIHPFQVNVDSSGIEEVMDQNQISHNGFFPINATNGAGQVIVIGQTGELSKVTVRLNTQSTGPNGEVELKIHQGNGPNAPVIATLPITVTSNSQSNYTIDLPTPFPSFQVNDAIFISMAFVSGTNVQWRKSNMNPYTAGKAAVFSGTWSEQNLDDMVFAIQMVVATTTSINALSVTQDKQLGVGVLQPVEKLEVNGAIKLSGASSDNPEAGTIRWNATTLDFEGYNGTKWQSLTKADSGWGPIANATANERQKISSPDAGFTDYFGQSVSIYQDYAIVGAPSSVGLVNNAGAAFIFKRYGQNWIQQAKLVASDGAVSDYFGKDVSINENYAVVGSYLDDDAGTSSGSAYVFIRNGETWTQQAKLVANDAASNDNFGGAVSIFGNYIIIGASSDDDNGDASGSIYVFERNGVSWNQQVKLAASDGVMGDKFGTSVHIDGNYLVVGAPFKANGDPDIGAAYVFKRNTTTNTWTQESKLLPTNVLGNTYFGEDVSILDSTVVVSARLYDEAGTDAGVAFVYTKSTTWGIPQKLLPNDITPGDWFGLSVDISSQYIVITASKPASAKGYACIFKNVNQTWIQESKLTGSDSIPGDYFGFSCAVYDDFIIIGAPFDDVTNNDEGSIYFFSK